MQNDCSGTGTHWYGEPTVGFTWTDGTTGDAAVLSAQLEFQPDLDCNTAPRSQSTLFNGIAASSYAVTSAQCACLPTAQPTVTITLPPTAYVLGGINKLTMTTAGNYLGVTSNAAFGGNYGLLTVCGSPGPAPTHSPTISLAPTPAVSQCTSGTDAWTGSPWVVCAVSGTHAWLSANSGGNYHIDKICQSLGYSTSGQWGGTCGSVCGYCQGGTTDCTQPGTERYDDGNNANNCGSDANGPLWCNTVQWQCLP